jgi:hypothetical protein
MKVFTIEEFTKACPEYASANITSYQIMAVSEMIFSQVGLRYRDTSWDETNVPLPIKNASIEQMRFMLEHDIPFVDYDKTVKAGNMSANIKTDYSTLALRILANAGYIYRGSRMSDNMALTIPFGE